MNGHGEDRGRESGEWSSLEADEDHAGISNALVRVFRLLSHPRITPRLGALLERLMACVVLPLVIRLMFAYTPASEPQTVLGFGRTASAGLILANEISASFSASGRRK